MSPADVRAVDGRSSSARASLEGPRPRRITASSQLPPNGCAHSSGAADRQGGTRVRGQSQDLAGAAPTGLAGLSGKVPLGAEAVEDLAERRVEDGRLDGRLELTRVVELAEEELDVELVDGPA